MSEEEAEIFYHAAEGALSDLEKHIKRYPSSLHCKDHRNRTPLFHAALTDREKNAQLLIKKGLTWWDEDSTGATPLHWAVHAGATRIIRLILHHQHTPTGMHPCLQKDKDGVTPVHIAARRPSDKVLKKDVYKQTPLMCAAGVRLPQAVNVVLLLGRRKPVAVSARAVDGQTALHLAVAADNIPVIDALLDDLQTPSDAIDQDFRMPLHYAADFGNITAIERLQARGARDGKDNFGVSCAHYAAQNSAKAMALLMRNAKGQIKEVKDRENRSCFMWAVVAGNVDAVEFLLQNCQPARNELDSHGLTALHLAALMGNERMCKLLVKQGWQLAGGDKNFATPMHLAAGRGHTDVVSCLVTAGADMKATDFMERTAIFPACFGGQAHTLYVMIRELGFEWRTTVDNQVRPIADAMGRTPLHAAAYAGFSHCITQMLKIEEEDATSLCIPLVGAVDHNGETALHVAATRGRLDCVLVLLNNGAAINALDNQLRTPWKCAEDAKQKAVSDHLRHEGALNYEELSELAKLIIGKWLYRIIAPAARLTLMLNDTECGVHRNTTSDLEKHIKRYPSSLHCKDHRNRTPLFHAALTDREKNAQLLIKKGLTWWDEDSTGATPLHWAVHAGATRIIRLILHHQHTPTGMHPCLQKDKDGVTPVHIAARRPSDKVLKMLVDALSSEGKIMDGRALLDGKDRSPLHYAAAACSFQCCQFLIDSPVLNLLVDQKDVYKQTPLMCAAGVRLPQAVNVVLLLGRRKPVAVSARAVDGQTALHLAVAADNIPVIDALLDDLQTPSDAIDQDFRMPLHYAADFGNITAIERLQARGARDGKDNFGVSCAHYAAQNSAKAMALLMRNAKGQIKEVKDRENRSCFMWAVVAGNVDAVEFLLQNCQPARNELDSHGLTALHLAALMGNERMCKLLVKQGWQLAGGDKNFATPMHLAAGRGHTDVVSCLVTAGADMKATDFMERTAIFPACFGGQAHTLYVMIRELGFEWRTTVDNQVRPIADAMGRTPLHAAAYAGFSHCITQMLKIEEEDATSLCIPLVGAVDHNGETALHVAATRGRLDCVLVLLNNGAAINALDNQLRTPWKCAEDAKQKAVSDHLRHEGALNYEELSELAKLIIGKWLYRIIAPAARLTLMLNDTECGVHRNTTDPATVASDVYTVRLVVSFSFSALTEDDRIFQLRCVHHRGGERKDVRSMQAFYDAQDVVRHQLLTSSDAPKCHYSLHLNTLDGGAVNNAKVGDMIFHRWECGKSGDFRFRVYRCFVHNGHRQSFMLVDDNGCSLDETILPHPKYDETNGVIYAPAKAFRFSRTKRVHFNCLLQVCARADAECAKSIPPHCPRSQQKRDLPKNLTIEERLMRIGQPIDGKLAAMDATRDFDGLSSEIQPKRGDQKAEGLDTMVEKRNTPMDGVVAIEDNLLATGPVTGNDGVTAKRLTNGPTTAKRRCPSETYDRPPHHISTAPRRPIKESWRTTDGRDRWKDAGVEGA
ncbi:unnamed protein product, partial [Mesorhabditis spiculigera]